MNIEVQSYKNCKKCGIQFEFSKKRSMQLYCVDCSYKSDKEKRKPEFIHDPAYIRNRDRHRDNGLELTKRRKIYKGLTEFECNHYVRVKFPFSYVASKNAIYTLARGGHHVAIRAEARKYRDNLIIFLKNAVKDLTIKHNKLWIDIFVEKPNHRGDAANLVDFICDAVKVATGLDDRWFSIGQVDWSVNKKDPHIFLTIYQEDNVEDAIVCSYCGRIQPLKYFHKNKSGPLGHSRVCIECSREAKK